MNILIGKTGRNIYFNNKKWSSIGGDVDAPALILKLAKCNPSINFYIGQVSDFDEFEFKNEFKNIFPLNLNIKIPYQGKETRTEKHFSIEQSFPNVKFDKAIFYKGMESSATHRTFKYLTGRGENLIYQYPNLSVYNIIRNHHIYSYFYHNRDFPITFLVPDPRQLGTKFNKEEGRLQYSTLCSDFYNTNVEYKMQLDCKLFQKYISDVKTAKKDYIEFPGKYSDIATVPLSIINKPKFEDIAYNKSNEFILILNKGSVKKVRPGVPQNPNYIDRFAILQEYILDNDIDVKIYGKYDDEDYKKYPQLKGTVDFFKIKDTLKKVKATFLISIEYEWVTYKIFEMVLNGVVPLLHYSYDTQKHLKIPEYLRCIDKDDFKKKLNEINTNEELRLSLLKECYDNLLHDDFFNGRYITKELLGIEPEVLDYDLYKLYQPKLEIKPLI